jgi:hypothetical protein
LRPQKKRTVILFEILIGLSLTAILLTFLFSFFVESAKIEKKLETARMEIGARAHLQTRLQTVLTALCQDQRQFFYTQEEDLYTIFDQGIDPDPLYSGPVSSRIFLDGEKHLCLATWPLSEEKKGRKEILMSQVDAFEFEFLGKPTEKKEKIRPIHGDYAWRTQWPKTELAAPSMIRLKITRNKTPIEFAFILPAYTPLITYTERKT